MTSHHHDRDTRTNSIWLKSRQAFYVTTIFAGVAAAAWLRFNDKALIALWSFIMDGNRNGAHDPEHFQYVVYGLMAGLIVVVATITISTRRHGRNTPMGSYWIMTYGFAATLAAFIVFGHFFTR